MHTYLVFFIVSSTVSLDFAYSIVFSKTKMLFLDDPSGFADLSEIPDAEAAELLYKKLSNLASITLPVNDPTSFSPNGHSGFS